MSKKLKIFLAVSFGWTWIVGGSLYALHIPLNSVPGISMIALLYMTVPFVASLIAERGLVKERLRTPVRNSKAAVIFILSPIAAIISIIAVYFLLMFVFGNILHVPQFGAIATTSGELMKAAINLLGAEAVQKAGTPPPPAVLLIATLWGAIVAGWTINGLFAMGEEYGWRGLLWDELKKFGTYKANALIGLIWGAWHAPLIIQGYNYPGHPVLGIFLMVLFATGLSLVLTALRELNKSVWPAAAAHGMFNGLAVMVVLFALNANTTLVGLLGILGSAICAAVGVVLWSIVRRRASPQG